MKKNGPSESVQRYVLRRMAQGWVLEAGDRPGSWALRAPRREAYRLIYQITLNCLARDGWIEAAPIGHGPQTWRMTAQARQIYF